MTKYEQTTIEDILQSKRVLRCSFSEAERATIAREHARLLDRHAPGADEAFTKELKPLLDLIQDGDDSGFKNAMAAFVKAASLGTVDTSIRVPRGTVTTSFLHREHCTASWSMSPPYLDASGDPVGDFTEEPAVLNGEPHPFFVTRTARAYPDEGLLSVGAANGNLGTISGIIEYAPSSSWKFGDENSAEASIFIPVNFPGGPLTAPETIEVSVSAGIDSVFPGSAILFNPGPEDSAGDGLVAVLGKLYLTVYGNTVFNGFACRTAQIKFLQAWKSNSGSSGMVGTTIYQNDFSVSTALSLRAGQSNVLVAVSVNVWALRAGTEDEPFSFAAVNFSREGAGPLFPLNKALSGPPVEIREIGVTLCPVILEAIDVVTV